MDKNKLIKNVIVWNNKSYLNKQVKEAGDEHSVEISEKEYFVNKYGGDTKEFYFEIESECITDGDFAPFQLLLKNNGKLSYVYNFKGERSTFDASKD